MAIVARLKVQEVMLEKWYFTIKNNLEKYWSLGLGDSTAAPMSNLMPLLK